MGRAVSKRHQSRPWSVEEFVEPFAHFSQDRVQQHPVEQIIETAAISLTEGAFRVAVMFSSSQHRASPYYKPPARPLDFLRQCLLHCQHVGLWSLASHYADNVVYGLRGLHPQPKWRRVSTFVDSTAAHSLARGGRVRDVLPGRVILARILKAPEPTGRAACCPLRV